jgi:hypothetical protein
MKEKKKIREITTIYSPVNGKIDLYYFEPAPAVKLWNSVVACWGLSCSKFNPNPHCP